MTAIQVCFDRDVECGDFPRNWCATCPKRGASPVQGAASAISRSTAAEGQWMGNTAASAVDVCAEMRAMCSSCGGTGDVTRVDGEWMGRCTCPYGTEAAASATDQGAAVEDDVNKPVQGDAIAKSKRILNLVDDYVESQLVSDGGRGGSNCRLNLRLALMAEFEHAALAERAQAAQPAKAVAEYTPGRWFDARTLDEMQAFYLSRLPAIRDAAKEHGYAIGLHGSQRRDFDLMAMQWRADASDKDMLAHAIAVAACGITRDGAFQWESKPSGRFAVSLPVCWTDHGNPDFDKPSVGHIDLSVIEPAPATGMRAAADFVAKRAEEYLRDNASTEHDTGATIWHFGDAGRDYYNSLVELAEDLRTATPAPEQEAAPQPAGPARDEKALFSAAYCSYSTSTGRPDDVEWAWDHAAGYIWRMARAAPVEHEPAPCPRCPIQTAYGPAKCFDCVGEQEAAQVVAVAEPESRFYMDHGMWHDRETGQHLWTQDQYDENARAIRAESAAPPAAASSESIIGAWNDALDLAVKIAMDGPLLTSAGEHLYMGDDCKAMALMVANRIRDLKSDAAGRFRAQGGITNNESSGKGCATATNTNQPENLGAANTNKGGEA